jgi:ribosomal protein S18 acetylase RimI-like enzyme
VPIETLHITLAAAADATWLAANDRHVSRSIVDQKIERGEILVALLGETRIGWLRWGYFWDEVPFMNLLYVVEQERGRSHGKELVLQWEALMQSRGFGRVLTSTLSDETAQHFYRKLGYRDTGSLLLPDEALEIILMKTLTVAK